MKEVDSKAVRGRAVVELEKVVSRLEDYIAEDPHLRFQAAAFCDGEPVLDVWGGPDISGESVMVAYSASKNTIGVTIGMLLEQGLLDLDERVGKYWPEFAGKGKEAITVRQLLSHQAGLPQADPPLSWDEILDDHAASKRLCETSPYWRPGSAFGYHGLTIGNLASELVFRITGRTLQEFYDEEIRRRNAIDFYLGLPATEEDRRIDVDFPVNPYGDTRELPSTPLTPVVMSPAGPPRDVAHEADSRRFGHPAALGVGSARGLARLLASAVTGVAGADPLLGQSTVDEIGQQQAHGYDEVLALGDRAYGIVFQKPTASRPFGGPRAFGHDGAVGALATVDPVSGVAFGWITPCGPWPGGGDMRAVALSRELGRHYRR